MDEAKNKFKQYAAIDFEFFNSNEKQMTVIAAAIHFPQEDVRKYDLTKEEQVSKLKFDLYQILNTHILISFAVIAEARAFLSLGLDPLMWQWIDLYVEFILVCNSNDRLKYGKYIDKNGEICHSVPVNILQSEEEKKASSEDHTESPTNLINAVYKLMDIRLDSKRKDEMRNLILSKDLVKIKENMDEILEYCASDTEYLLKLDLAIRNELWHLGVEGFREDQKMRGRYAVCTAKCEHIGLPINMRLLEKVIEKTPEIINLHKEEVNKIFPFFVDEFTPEPKVFKSGKIFNYKTVPAKKDMSAYQEYVASLNIENFPVTKTGKYKFDKDTLEVWGYWGGLEALWKYGRTESSLKWFRKDNKNGFFDRMGTDNRVRPYYGIFGTQTGRNAPKATTFIPAMSTWLRCLIQAPEGKFIVGSDFSQQEVYVGAALSGDSNLMQAYLAGDVYLEFGKQAGMIPANGTKKSHKFERQLCKSTELGLQYGMGKEKLRTKLKLDTKQDISEELTVSLIQSHRNTYPHYWQYVKSVSDGYLQGVPLTTNDGWVLFCDNPRVTSVRNFLIQGNSASITRLAIVKATEAGLQVLFGLHDAIYIETKYPEQDSEILENCMRDATADILKENSTNIRIDTKTISHDMLWVDEKGEEDLKKLKDFLGIVFDTDSDGLKTYREA